MSTAASAWVLRSRRVITTAGLRPADVVVAGELIRAVTDLGAGEGALVEDLGDRVLMPGLVDPHVHVNEPGRTEWEGFDHATRAAAASGITTLADMPLNSSPVTVNGSALTAKRRAAEGQCWVDVGFHGGLVPGNARDPAALEELLAGGVLGMKAFLCDSGLGEFPAVGRAELERVMPLLAERGRALLVHAEAIGGDESVLAPPTRRYREYLATRPPGVEARAHELLVELCRATGCAVHVVHLASAEALPFLAQARAEALPLTIETCPHYLTFAAEEIPDGDTRFKCAPPIREARHREGLWRGLLDGTIDLIATDHSPCPPAMKALGDSAKGPSQGDFAVAWGGIASLQLSLPAVWTAARARGLGLERLAAWLCLAPARLLGLEHRKGRLAPGLDADLVVWDPEAAFRVEGARLHHRHPTTPYDGRELFGVVRKTWLRGQPVMVDGQPIGRPRGRLLG